MRFQGVAAAWLRQEDWPRWLEIDPDFQPDYAHWLKRMEKAVAKHQAAGIPIVNVMVDPDEFMAWAKANGGTTNSDQRARYAAWKAMQDEGARER